VNYDCLFLQKRTVAVAELGVKQLAKGLRLRTKLEKLVSRSFIRAKQLLYVVATLA